MNLKKFQKFLLLIISFFISSLGFAQSIKGVVYDKTSQDPLPGVTVQIKSLKLTTQTNAAGYFEFKNIAKGTYSISVEYVGYGEEIESVNLAGLIPSIKIGLKEKTTQLGTVTVKYKFSKESDVLARRTEKNSNNFLNVVSAQTIQRSPDLNVAEVAKRISGISLVKSPDTKDEFVSFRGLEPRYTNVTINGVQIPSPDDKNKTIPLNIFPSELVGNLVAAKSLTPEMALDAIGGTVDIEFKDAPSKDIIEVNFSGGFNPVIYGKTFLTFNPSQSHRLDPASQFGHLYNAVPTDFPVSALKFNNPKSEPNLLGNFTFSKRMLKNKLGFILGVSDEDSYSVNAGYFQDLTPQANKLPSDGNRPYSQYFFNQKYFYHNNVLGLSSKLDFILNSKNKFIFSGVYTRNHNLQSLSNESYPLLEPDGKTYYSLPTVDSILRSQNINQNLFNISLKGNHELNKKINIDYTLTLGRSEGRVPDQAELDLYGQVNEIRNTGFIILPNATTRTWQRNFDKLYAGYFNLKYKWSLFGKDSYLTGGTALTHKERSNFRNIYTLNAIDQGNLTAVPYIPSFTENTFLVVNKQGNPSNNPDNYFASETLNEFYIEEKFALHKIEGVIGLRDEITHQSNFIYSTNVPIVKLPNDFYYNDIAPEISLKYKFDDFKAIRLAYYQAISRPNYYELVAYTNYQGASNVIGNPLLKHARSYNFDARYEIFSKQEDEILVGVFYKRILDAIEYSYTSGSIFQTLKPINVSSPTLSYGSEINFIHYFGNFGISGNYTFNISQIKETKKLDVQVDNAGNYLGSPQSNGSYSGLSVDVKPIVIRPLQGQSRDLANLSLLYQNKKSKLNFNFSILFQGKRIDASQIYYNFDYFQQDYWNFSFSGDKKIGDRFTIYLKANNISNAPVIIRTAGNYFVSSNRFGSDYLFGLRYRIK